MISIFLIFSFILHIISFFTIYLLYKNTRSKNLAEVEEVYNVLEIYLEEIKLENTKLQETLLQNKKDNKTNEQSELYKRHLNEKRANTGSIEKEDIENKEDSSQYSIEKLEQKTRHTNDIVQGEISLLTRALNLQEEGYTIDQIAKELKRGKTEIELLLKLRT